MAGMQSEGKKKEKKEEEFPLELKERLEKLRELRERDDERKERLEKLKEEREKERLEKREDERKERKEEEPLEKLRLEKLRELRERDFEKLRLEKRELRKEEEEPLEKLEKLRELRDFEKLRLEKRELELRLFKEEEPEEKLRLEKLRELFLRRLPPLPLEELLELLRSMRPEETHLQHDTIYASTQSNVVKEDQPAAKSMSESTNEQFNYQPFSKDEFEGVHVAGKKLFQFKNLPQLLNWEEYGLRITVPEGAVSSSETIEVSVTALVGGEFILPEDSELVSAVYTITVSKPLLKPVLLEIQHCVSIETPSHANDLSFVASSNGCCPFEFQTVNEGSFPVGERYGSIYISKFSHLGIIYKKIKGWVTKLRHPSRQTTSCVTIPLPSPTLPHSSTNTDKSTSTETESCLAQDIDVLPASWYYFAQPLYENKSPGKKWLLMFLFGKDLNALIKFMNEKFKSAESDQEFSFRFESSNGILEIHTDKCSEGWSISPHLENPTNEESSMENPIKVTKLSKSEIDAYGQMNPPCFPQRRFTITATLGSNTNPELRHLVTFKGIISDNKVFLIALSKGDDLLQDSAKPGISSPTVPKKTFRRKSAALYKLITPENIGTIAYEVYSEGLITYNTLQDCMTDARKPADRAHSLLNPLHATMDQPGVLEKLIKVLKNNEAFRSIAEEMEHDI